MDRTSRVAPERWRQIIEQQNCSGLSIARFCRERRIAQSSLFAWKRRLAGKAQAAAPAFVLVKPAPLPQPGNAVDPSDGAIELHLGRGRHILLRPGFDGPTLAAVLAVLAGETYGPPEER